MKKWTKRILITLGSLILLFLAVIILIPVLFGDKIEAAVKDVVNTSINATVDWGEWDITLLKNFPNLTVEVSDVKVGNVAPFEGIELARIGELDATVDVMSLFGEQIAIKSVMLVRPRIHVVVLEDGRANWDIMKADSSAVDEPVDTTAAAAFNIALNEYAIEDAHVIYDDASLAFSLQLAGLDHSGSGDFTQDLFMLKTTTHADTVNVLFDGIKYLRNAKADITADLDMDMGGMKFTFKTAEATVNQLVLGFDGWLAMPSDDIDMDITFNTKKSDLGTLLSLVPAEFATDLSGVKMSGKVGLAGSVKGTYNDTTMPGFALALDVDKGRFQYPDLPASVEDIFIDLKVNSPGGSDLNGLVVDLKRFGLKMAGNPVEARMLLTRPMTDPSVDAELHAQLDLSSVKQVVPMEQGDALQGLFKADVKVKGVMSDVEAQRFEKVVADGSMSMRDMVYRSDSLPFDVGIKSLQFDFSPSALALTGFNGNVGSSDIHATGRLDNYLQWWLKDSALVGSFDIKANKLDVNELMGPAVAETTPVEASTSNANEDTTTMNVIAIPGNIDFRMGLNIGEVIYDDLHLANVRGGLRVHDQRADLNDIFFNLFGGSVTMAGGYDTKNIVRPAVDLHFDVRDIDIEQTVTYVDVVMKMMPIAKSCKGRVSTDLTMNATLDEHMSIQMNSLEGKGNLRTASVRIEGFKPLDDIAKVLKIEALKTPTLNDLAFGYRFEQGKLITDPFDVKLDRVKANVAGSTTFEDLAIDYDMKAKIPSDIFGAGAASTVNDLLGKANAAIGSNIEVPKELDVTVKITGTIDKPIIKPVFAGGSTDLKETVVAAAKEELNTQIAKAKEEAIAKARAEAERLVAEAQTKADGLKADARREAADLKAKVYKAADDGVANAKDGVERMAAKIVGDKLKKEADKKEEQFVAEADKRLDATVEAVRRKGEELILKAEETNTVVQ